jgi:hypothetical protein
MDALCGALREHCAARGLPPPESDEYRAVHTTEYTCKFARIWLGARGDAASHAEIAEEVSEWLIPAVAGVVADYAMEPSWRRCADKKAPAAARLADLRLWVGVLLKPVADGMCEPILLYDYMVLGRIYVEHQQIALGLVSRMRRDGVPRNGLLRFLNDVFIPMRARVLSMMSDEYNPSSDARVVRRVGLGRRRTRES